LLAGFGAWGIEATLNKTVGMFAIALWDVRERTLHLARDRFGEKPLYYGWAGSGAGLAGPLCLALNSRRCGPFRALPTRCAARRWRSTCGLWLCWRRAAFTRVFLSWGSSEPASMWGCQVKRWAQHGSEVLAKRIQRVAYKVSCLGFEIFA